MLRHEESLTISTGGGGAEAPRAHRGAEPLMRLVGIILQFTRDTGHPHPHLMDALNNYRGLLMAMGDSQDVAVEKLRALAQSYGVSL